MQKKDLKQLRSRVGEYKKKESLGPGKREAQSIKIYNIYITSASSRQLFLYHLFKFIKTP